MTAPVSTPQDLRTVVDAVAAGFAEVPDDAWELPARGLDWDCRDTAAHILDDLTFYALNLSSRVEYLDDYVPLLEPEPWRPGSPPMNCWPDPKQGTPAIVRSLDAAGGLLVAVTATAPPGHLGYHPWGNSDASGFAGMGIVEAACHGWDVLVAQGIDLALDDELCDRVLNRLFPVARRTGSGWQDLLAATGRTDETSGVRWKWDSSVREEYGPA
jgi:hypothetical protein